MKIGTYNIGHYSSACRKGLEQYLRNFDILALQETKESYQGLPNFSGYHCYYSSSSIKNYSGVGIISRIKAKNIYTDLGEKDLDGIWKNEGRFICAEFDNFFVANCYVPNAKHDCSRLTQQLSFFQDLYKYCLIPNKNKNLFFLGDYNIGKEECDIELYMNNYNSSGFLKNQQQHIKGAEKYAKYHDLLREKYPMKKDDRNRRKYYTYYSNQSFARMSGLGWRIDGIYASPPLFKKIKNKYDIWSDHRIPFSDHVPVVLEIDQKVFSEV